MKREWKRFLKVSFLCLAISLPAWTQGTDLGTIRGTITDSSGAVVPNAGVEVTDVATNTARKLSTDHEGNYEAAGLRAGDYKVMVTATGFTNAEITGIALRGGDVQRADARL